MAKSKEFDAHFSFRFFLLPDFGRTSGSRKAMWHDLRTLTSRPGGKQVDLYPQTKQWLWHLGVRGMSCPATHGSRRCHFGCASMVEGGSKAARRAAGNEAAITQFSRSIGTQTSPLRGVSSCFACFRTPRVRDRAMRKDQFNWPSRDGIPCKHQSQASVRWQACFRAQMWHTSTGILANCYLHSPCFARQPPLQSCFSAPTSAVKDTNCKLCQGGSQSIHLSPHTAVLRCVNTSCLCVCVSEHVSRCVTTIGLGFLMI